MSPLIPFCLSPPTFHHRHHPLEASLYFVPSMCGPELCVADIKQRRHTISDRPTRRIRCLILHSCIIHFSRYCPQLDQCFWCGCDSPGSEEHRIVCLDVDLACVVSDTPLLVAFDNHTHHLRGFLSLLYFPFRPISYVDWESASQKADVFEM